MNVYIEAQLIYQTCGFQEDTVKCMVNVTKRCVVSIVAKVYDPLGFVTPVTFLVKYFCKHFGLMNWVGMIV